MSCQSYEAEEGNADKIRDNCHTTGICRGAAQTQCNLNVKQSSQSFIPIASHSTANYDSPLLIKELTKQASPKVNFKVNPQTCDKFISNT